MSTDPLAKYSSDYVCVENKKVLEWYIWEETDRSHRLGDLEDGERLRSLVEIPEENPVVEARAEQHARVLHGVVTIHRALVHQERSITFLVCLAYSRSGFGLNSSSAAT